MPACTATEPSSTSGSSDALTNAPVTTTGGSWNDSPRPLSSNRGVNVPSSGMPMPSPDADRSRPPAESAASKSNSTQPPAYPSPARFTVRGPKLRCTVSHACADVPVAGGAVAAGTVSAGVARVAAVAAVGAGLPLVRGIVSAGWAVPPTSYATTSVTPLVAAVSGGAHAGRPDANAWFRIVSWSAVGAAEVATSITPSMPRSALGGT